MKNVHFSSSSNEKEARSSTEFHEPLNFLILVLLGVLGVRFRGFGISPLVEHDVIMLFFIVAIVIYGIAFLGMKLGPQNADYLYKFKFVCVICAILACDLLASILVDPPRVLIINLCGIIVELIRRKYKQICKHLCHATNVVLNTSNNLFNKICLCQSICRILGWIQHTSKAFNKFALFGGTKKQDQGDGGQVADMV